jgi:hypothetical protein
MIRQMKLKVQSPFIFSGLLLLHFFLSIHPVSGQTIKDNAVKVTARYPDRSEAVGFGIIFGEKDDTLYFVTTLKILVSDYTEMADSIFIEFHQKNYKLPATPFGIEEEKGFMILRAHKPVDFQWNNDFCSSAHMEINNIVWIIGREGDWNDAERKYSGQIVDFKGYEIDIDVPTQETGILGAPIILNDCIAGIIVFDEGNHVTAIDIDYFVKYLGYYLGYDDEKEAEKPYHPPYLIIGADYGLPFFSAGMKYPDTHTGGFYLETGLTPHLSLRIARNYTNIFSHTYTVWDNTYQFRNHITSYSFSMLFVVQPADFEASNGYVFLGYSVTKHHPELRLNNTNRMSLRDYDEFHQSYKDYFGSISAGFGANGFVTKRILFGFELSFEYYLNKYLHIDPLEPFKNDKNNDLLICLKFNTGIVLGNKEPEYKILKPKRINPFKFN